MLRVLGIFVALALASTPADAQVFKPKSKKAAPAKTEKAETKADKAPAKAAKKQPRAAATKKRVTAKKKKARADKVARSESAASSESDKDYVKIWDDDEIE